LILCPIMLLNFRALKSIIQCVETIGTSIMDELYGEDSYLDVVLKFLKRVYLY